MIRHIDLDSIKPNPNAGRTMFLVPGKSRTYTAENGTMITERDVHRIYTLHSDAQYLFRYEPLNVTCVHCGAVSSVEDLEDEWDDYGNTDYEHVRGCPACHQSYCCEQIDYETIENALKRKSNA